MESALLDVFSNRVLPDGSKGFFHPDNLTFGEGIYVSKIVAAAQAVIGVQNVQVTRLERWELVEPAPGETDADELPTGSVLSARTSRDCAARQRSELPRERAPVARYAGWTMNQTCGCCAGTKSSRHSRRRTAPACRPSLIAPVRTPHSSRAWSRDSRTCTLTCPRPTAAARCNASTRCGKLTTRELSDPSIALLNAWAIVADVLTFYQERIANEGYLLTATERLSVLELARLVGYKLRPGVSASVFLAFTVANGFTGTIPAGTRAQSIPGTGETAQFFESSVDLTARDTWNNLQPRLTRPQVITLVERLRDGC